jgi:hypothetical protein
MLACLSTHSTRWRPTILYSITLEWQKKYSPKSIPNITLVINWTILVKAKWKLACKIYTIPDKKWSLNYRLLKTHTTKKWISNLMCTTRFWNNLYQVYYAESRNIGKPNNLKILGAINPKGLNGIAKIC